MQPFSAGRTGSPEQIPATAKRVNGLVRADSYACAAVIKSGHIRRKCGQPFYSTDIIRVEDGKVAEHWGTTNNLSLMQQIGAVPQ
ncbi:ester cyclase [Arthrobacter sp. MA-N2]|uniref:ester cyclase n=1 Tax=Arthrobacter sp. MA-N2 TaxID=1101188 RepID=UPI001E39DD83|nr:ester cyclase [Arthrobacter sp. MA-N2]